MNICHIKIAECDICFYELYLHCMKELSWNIYVTFRCVRVCVYIRLKRVNKIELNWIEYIGHHGADWIQLDQGTDEW
jgi:hypothetical protein